MWTVIYIAKTKAHAVILAEALEKSNIIVHIKHINVGKCTDCSYEILVPHTEVGQAQAIVIENSFY